MVESLVVSSHEFSLFLLCFRYTNKTHKNYFFYVSHFFEFHRTLLFLFLVFFSFHSFKYWRTLNIHVNIHCELLSPLVLVDSTRFSLYAIMEVSRKPNHTHFKSWFQNIHFSCPVSHDQCPTRSQTLSLTTSYRVGNVAQEV